jgi:hypothetical protein
MSTLINSIISYLCASNGSVDLMVLTGILSVWATIIGVIFILAQIFSNRQTEKFNLDINKFRDQINDFQEKCDSKMRIELQIIKSDINKFGDQITDFKEKCDGKIHDELQVIRTELKLDIREFRSSAIEAANDTLKKGLEEYHNDLLTRFIYMSELAQEWSEIRIVLWQKLSENISLIVEEPELNITEETRNRLKILIKSNNDDLIKSGNKYSYLLELLHENPASRERARAHVRQLKIREAISILEMQKNTASFQELGDAEKSDIDRTIRELTKN